MVPTTVTDKVTSATSRISVLEQRRAERERDALVKNLRSLLKDFDTRALPFDAFACGADWIGGRLADLALAGVAA
jgi:hypothetical protein